MSVECPDKELLYRLNQERSARRTALVISDLNQGHQRLIRENDDVEDDLRDEATTALRNGVSRILEVGEKTYFLNVFRPKPRLVIIGAVHISQALAPMAHMVGYDVEIIDPRTAFASPERFPASRIYPDWPQDILTKRPLDRHTALAALTHDPRIDDWALAAALEAGCFMSARWAVAKPMHSACNDWPLLAQSNPISTGSQPHRPQYWRRHAV